MTDEPQGPPENGEPIDLAERRRRRTANRMRPVAEAGPVAARLQKAHAFTGDAPYEPVGYDAGRYFVLDCERYLRELLPRDITGRMLDSVCGGTNYLRERYARMRQGKPVDGFQADKAARDLMAACHCMGYWSPSLRRGPGAWVGADGDLILHRGDCLVIKGVMHPLGRVGDFVYIHGPPLPILPKLAAGARPGHELLDRLEKWPFERGVIDARLMLGMLCVMILSGALRFRPHLFLAGEIDTGKSRLQTLVRHLLSPNGLVDVTDATGAGLWQALAHRSLPIALDEFEPDDPDQIVKHGNRIVQLARQASTGGLVRRGNANHAAQEFPVMSAFLASATLPPPLNVADASRWLVLTVHKTNFPPIFSVDRLEEIGAALTVRLAGMWPMFQGQVMPELRRVMFARGYPGRMVDLYGTLLGLAGVALFDSLEEMRFEAMLDHAPIRELLDSAHDQHRPEWRSCLDHLASCRIERTRATSEQFGELIAAASRPILAAGKGLQGRLFDEAGGDEIPGDLDGNASSAQGRLMAFGLRVAVVSWPARDGATPELVPVLQIANKNQQLAELFAGTRWRTTSESVAGGGWTNALRRGPGVRVSPKPVWFRNGVYSRALNIPLALVLDGATPAPPEPYQGDAGEADAVVLH